MTRRYLFGPSNRAYAGSRLAQHRAAGTCLAFAADDSLELTIRCTDRWPDVAARFPAGWQPELIVLYLPYMTIPACLWQAPVPIVGLALDWNLLWHGYRLQLPCCDLVLTDTPGVAVCRRAGIDHVQAANLFGLPDHWPVVAPTAGPRDIDLLFVGNLNPGVQGERLPWLQRLARFADRWRVVIRGGVPEDEYRALLARTRIAFNRSIRGECNLRVFEAVAAGALLFQEAENREVPAYLTERRECVLYDDANFETLLAHYLAAEDERVALATAAQYRLSAGRFATLWQDVLTKVIEPQWEELVARARRRVQLSGWPALQARIWQTLSSSRYDDKALAVDLGSWLEQQPQDSAAQQALGVVQSLGPTGNDATPADRLRTAAAVFARAGEMDSANVGAALNHVECLIALGDHAGALALAQRTLTTLEQAGPANVLSLEGPHYPPRFDAWRTAWERAAWQHAGAPQREAQGKYELLRSRLHGLLAELTGELSHHYESVLAWPDLPGPTLALGTALARAGQSAAAIPHLRRAVDRQPFDSVAARTLHDVLGASGAFGAQRALRRDRGLLARAAPDLVPPEPWFADAASLSASAAGPTTLRWEGAVAALHSLALVNRELCTRLRRRGQPLTVQALEPPPGAGVPQVELPRELRACLRPDNAGPAGVVVRHHWPPDLTPPPSGHWVVMQPWEFGSLPAAWLAPMRDAIDEVWVYSQWLRDCYVQSGVPAAQVQVIPLGVDPERFRPEARPVRLRTSKRFRFLFVGGTIQRKGIDLLLRAYAAAFTAADDVCLVIKDMGGGSFYQGQTAGQLIAEWQRDPAAPAIEYIDEPFNEAQLAGLYTACHCLVHPYRGEGFGLPIVEAMACGLPVIVTGRGPALDYCTPETAWLVPAVDRPLGTRSVGELATVGAPWLAEPDGDVLTELLGRAVAHPDEGRSRGLAASEFIRRRFTWEQSVAAIEARLAALAVQPIRRHAAHHHV